MVTSGVEWKKEKVELAKERKRRGMVVQLWRKTTPQPWAVILTFQEHLRGICTNESQLPAIDKFPMGYFVASAFTTISRDEVWKHLVCDTDRNLTKQTRTLRCT